jgi:hypothetical protein
MTFDLKPTLNQKTHLLETLTNDEALDKHFDIANGWNNFENITCGQIRYFHYLILNNKRDKLNVLMEQFGFKPKKYDR